MTSEKLYELLGNINENHIKEAYISNARRSKAIWIKWGMAAACLSFVLYAGMRLILPKSPADDTSALPMLTIAENIGDGMGFEGFMAYDASELVNENPWNETVNLSVLPVYRNQIIHDEKYLISEESIEECINTNKTCLPKIAGRLGLHADSMNSRGDAFEKDGILVEAGMTSVRVEFNPSLSFPEEYHFDYYGSHEDMTAVAEYFKDTYKDLLQMEHLQSNIHGGDYDIYRRQYYHIQFYDKSGDITEQIINYNFYPVSFGCDDEGNLCSISFSLPDLSEKVGDYPIISAKDATELLVKGNYITTVPYEMPGADYIAKVELKYRTGNYENFYMPYYRFYVELPEELEEDGLKTYGIYYVPAVEASYISNMPVWDGSFN